MLHLRLFSGQRGVFHFDPNKRSKGELYLHICRLALTAGGDLSISRGAGIWDFSMKPVELLRKIDKVGVYRFTGSIDAGGVPIHVEIITGYRFGRPTFAVGFAFDSESFGKLSEKLSGIGVDFLDAIGLELQVRFVPDLLSHDNVLLD